MKSLILWLKQPFEEIDNNGQVKTSYARLFGSIVILVIIRLSILGVPIAGELMTLFYYLIGYQLLSKVLNQLSPAIIEIFKPVLDKTSVITKKESEK